MIAIGHAGLVAGDDGVGDPVRQGAEAKGLVVAQTGHDDADQAPLALLIGLQLQVVLDPGGGKTGAQAAIDKGGPLEDVMNLSHLGGIEEAGEGEEHKG